MNIGVFFGGKSPEHDVSIITGELIMAELKKAQKTVIPVYIGKEGEWYIDDRLGELKFFQNKNYGRALKKLDQFELSLKDSHGKLVFVKKGLLGDGRITIDMVFPAFHGSNGEDGTMQGLFEIFNVPYVGCDVASSAIAFDKILTKLFYKSRDFPTTKFLYFDTSDWKHDKKAVLDHIKKELHFPVFVKPPKLGSSIGITRAKDEKELEFGIEVALHYGERVLVEEGVQNVMDITCCLVGNDEPEASLLQESVFESDLFNFEEKYLKDGGAQLGKATAGLKIPARLDEETTKEVQRMAKRIYRHVGCTGIARVDFLYDKAAKKIYANEINPMPGTVYHHLWKESGKEINSLLTQLLQFAMERHRRKNGYTYTFESGILDYANSMKLKLKK